MNLPVATTDASDRARTATARRLLDDGRQTRAMRWIMAIMLFLTVLAAALGLAMARAGTGLERQLAGRLTVQVVEADPARRDAVTRALLARLRATPVVAAVTKVDRARLAALLKPWLGNDGADPELPLPALLDVDLTAPDDNALAAAERAVHAVAPAARVDRHAAWMSPVAHFLDLLTWLAIGLVALLAIATTTVVLLAARSGLDTHRDTIGILHLLGSTDAQVARLFQRRIAFDTLLGGVIGTTLALVAVAVIAAQAAQLDSGLAAGAGLGGGDWLVLIVLPLLFAGLAMVAARGAVLGALRRVL